MICKRCQNYIPEDRNFVPSAEQGCEVPLQVAPGPGLSPSFYSALIWAVVARKDPQAKLLDLRAHVGWALVAL